MNNREKIQKEALDAVLVNGGSGVLCLATGAGKSKIAIDYAKLFYESMKKKFQMSFSSSNRKTQRRKLER